MSRFYLEREDKSSFLDLHNIDCMEFMSKCKDKQFGLAIVDPPYGINIAKENNGGCGWVKREGKSWDLKIPDKIYFNELFRITKNQIVWGGNYMTEYLPPKMCWIIWDKGQRNFSLADGEMAWSSFDKAMRIFEFSRGEAISENNKFGGRFHPTQKPVALYKWLLSKYAKPGDTILDTHLGSSSIAIACWDMRYNLTGCELDKEYFDTANERIKIHTTKKEKEEKFKELF